MSSLFTSVPILSASNYNNWKFRITAILRKEQCANVIDQDPPVLEEEKKGFVVQDAKAQSFIIQGVSDKHLDIIKDCKTAKEQMKALKDVFVRSSSFTKLTLWRKLFNLKSGKNESLEDHFLKFDTIIRDLQDLGSTIDETDKVCHLLLSLPSQYDAVITALETVTEVKMDFVKARLLDEELKLKSRGNTEEVSNSNFSLKASTGCYICGDRSHFKAQCPKRYNQGRNYHNRGRPSGRGQFYSGYRGKAQANAAKENHVLIAANFCNQKDLADRNVFVLDSGASNHFVKEELESYMHNVRNLEHAVAVHIANGQVLKASKIGELKARCQGKTITIEALIVPEIKHNLLSAAKMTSRGHYLIVKKNHTSICAENFTLICKNINGLYILKLDSFLHENCNVIVEDSDLWHRRLGHVGKDVIHQLGLPVPTGICSTCVEAKATRQPFYKNEKRSSAVGELIHSDICGPITPATINGERYFQVILDDFSHFLVVKVLKSKNEAEENLKQYIKEVERQHGTKVKRIRLDNGGEFSSNNFKSYCRNNGIKLEYTMSYSPQMNGKSERMNRTLMNKIRTKIIESGIPKFLWGEALKASAYEVNRLPTSALRRGQTPAMLWHGRNDISKLKVFGCRAWYTTLPKESKLNPRAKRAVMIGYCGGGYRLWVPKEEKIVKTRDVCFDESVLEYIDIERNINKEDKTEESFVQIQAIINQEEGDSVNQNTKEQNTEVVYNEDNEEERYNEENEEEKYNEEDRQDEDILYESSDSDRSESEEKTSKSGRVIKLPEMLKDYELYTAYCLLSESEEEPKTYRQASEHSEWKNAIKSELDSHKQLQTWTEAKLPEGQTAIETKWIFKIKEDGTKKARLVARGFQEPYKSDELSYAPVCRMSTIRMLLSVSVQNNWNLKQIDVPTAFLNSKLKHDVYIKVPEGLECKERTLKLNRALYGLRSAPKVWNDKFSEVMMRLGFRRSKYDFCLYCKDDVYLVLFVDDALITGDDCQIEKLLVDLHRELKIKALGNVSSFLGMQINKTNAGIRVSQPKIISKLLKEFNMENCKGMNTPMECGFQINTDETIIDVPFRKLIGCLMYLSTSTRPDITFCVSLLSRRLDKPTDQVWKAGKRILRYLQNTINMGLEYTREDNASGEPVVAYCDANWATDKLDRKSVSGAIIFYYGNPVSWFSKKQTCVALSTAESEYISAASAAQEIMNIKGLASDFDINCKPLLLCDNQSAISMSKTFENSKRVKHIDIRNHFLRNLIQDEKLEIKYVKSDDNIADMLTKPLSKELFIKFRIDARIL